MQNSGSEFWNISRRNISWLNNLRRIFLAWIFLGGIFLGVIFLWGILIGGIFLERTFLGKLFLRGTFLVSCYGCLLLDWASQKLGTSLGPVGRARTILSITRPLFQHVDVINNFDINLIIKMIWSIYLSEKSDLNSQKSYLESTNQVQKRMSIEKM